MLDASAFLAVPLRYGSAAEGRLYLTSAERHVFDETDIDFLVQVINHFTPMIENIRLVDRLASDAAEVERRRIMLDIHDSVIQPYIGLQLGLTAIDQKLAAGDANVRGDIQLLVEQIGNVVTNLRGYMHGLKRIAQPEDTLLPSVRRFAVTFTATTGIAVDVVAMGNIHINDRLAAALFQMVIEGLSNVRRHTPAMQATIVFARRENSVVLRIEDISVNGWKSAPFTPRSITERATALGGQVHVARRDDGGSNVIVEIPL
jgi:signal transduction histidine kinase